MFELTVKTLDGRDHSFTLPEEITIAQFKQQIFRSLEIPVEEQRLIFRGKVLNDDLILKADDMDRKVIHLVTRPPPAPVSTTSQDLHIPANITMQPSEPGVYVGEINVSSFITPDRIHEIVRQVIEHLGLNEEDTNLTVTDRGRGVEIQIELGSNYEVIARREISQRLANIRYLITQLNRHLNDIDNSGNSDNVQVFHRCPSRSVRGPVEVSSESSTDTLQPSRVVTLTQEQNVLEFHTLLHDFHILNTRLNGYLDQYASLVTRSSQPSFCALSTREQSMFQNIPTIMHMMSHIYHNISDLIFVSPDRDRQANITVNPTVQDNSDNSQRFGQNQNAMFEPSQSNTFDLSASPAIQQHIMSAVNEAMNPLLAAGGVPQRSSNQQPVTSNGAIVLNHVIAHIVNDEENGGSSMRMSAPSLSSLQPQIRFERSQHYRPVMTNRPEGMRPSSLAMAANHLAGFSNMPNRFPPAMEYHQYPIMGGFQHYHNIPYPHIAMPYAPPVMYPQAMRNPYPYAYFPHMIPNRATNRQSLFIRPGAPAYSLESHHLPTFSNTRIRTPQNDAAQEPRRTVPNTSLTDTFLSDISGGLFGSTRANREQASQQERIQALTSSEQMIADILGQLLPPLLNSGRERVQVLIGTAAPDSTPQVTTATSNENVVSSGVAPLQPQSSNQQITRSEDDQVPTEECPVSPTMREISVIMELESDEQKDQLDDSNLSEVSLSSIISQIQNPSINLSPEQDVFDECLSIIMDTLTFGNFINLLDGHIEDKAFTICLEKLISCLSKYRPCPISQRYRYYFMARRIADSLLDRCSIDLSTFNVNSGISPTKSLRLFMRYSMFRLLECLLSDECLEIPKKEIFQLLKCICAELRSLLIKIFVDANAELVRLQSGQLRSIFVNVPRTMLPFIELMARVIPRYMGNIEEAENIERFMIMNNQPNVDDNDLSTIVDIDRIQYFKIPVLRSRSEGYQSMIPYKRRKALNFNIDNSDDADHIHSTILQRSIDILNDERDPHPSVRMSNLRRIQQEAEDSLGTSFRQSLRKLILERIQMDEDFDCISERFPHLQNLKSDLEKERSNNSESDQK